MHHGTFKRLSGGIAAAALLCSASAHAGLVFSDGFESGDFSAWTVNATNPVWDGVDGSAPQSGSLAAFFGNPGGTSTISKTLNTVAGSTYNVSFWLKNEADASGLATPNSFAVSWGGVTAMSLNDSSDFDYQQYSFYFVGTGSPTDLSFSFSQTAAFWDFDSVQVEVPEPASLALVGLAGLLMAGSRRRPAPPPSA